MFRTMVNGAAKRDQFCVSQDSLKRMMDAYCSVKLCLKARLAPTNTTRQRAQINSYSRSWSMIARWLVERKHSPPESEVRSFSSLLFSCCVLCAVCCGVVWCEEERGEERGGCLLLVACFLLFVVVVLLVAVVVVSWRCLAVVVVVVCRCVFVSVRV